MVGIALKLFPIIRQRSNEARDIEDMEMARNRASRRGETMSILSTIKRGVTGQTPEEEAEIARAKKEAKRLSERLKKERRQERLAAKVAAIKDAPYHEEERRAARNAELKKKAGSVLKGVYSGVMSFGAEYAPKNKPTQTKTNTTSAGFGANSGFFTQANMFGSNPAQVKGKGKKQRPYNPWDNLR